MWFAFALMTVALTAYITWRFYADRMIFVPGQTTAGHHQIETECFSCHTPMAGVKSDACTQCHAEELERVDDSHPRSKFTDPRNADLLSKLEARECITCHIEHRDDRTLEMGVTLPRDFCQHCHADIGTERFTHEGLSFDTCQNAGCHNFHDNRALHSDYLEARLTKDREPLDGHVALTTRTSRAVAAFQGKALTAQGADLPAGRTVDTAIVSDWAATLHARMDVGCSDCHARASDAGDGAATWSDAVSVADCQACHAAEAEGFLASRHGMRIAAGLAPMRVADARIPMRDDAQHSTLTCTSCHGEHRFDRQFAAVDACVGCHDDQHSRGYLKSKHYALWKSEVAGDAVGTGVSCATCHLPREADVFGGAASVRHNQNDTLRPNDKMIATVCANCHAVEMAMNALADPDVIARGVEGTARVVVESMEMMRRTLATSSTSNGADP